MKVFIKILFFSLLLISCRNAKNKDGNQLITFDLKELPKVATIKLSDLNFVEIEYIPLETNDSSLIQKYGQFSSYKILSANDFFIINGWRKFL